MIPDVSPGWRIWFMAAILLAAGCGGAGLPALPGLSAGSLPDALQRQLKQSYDTVRAHPGDADANGRLGMLFHAWQQYDSAAVYYDRAHRVQPREFRWAYYLGSVQVAAGKNAQAAATLRSALQLNPQSLPARMKLGEALMGLGSLPEAETIYEAATAQHPEFAPGWYWLGRVLSARGNSVGAIEKFQRACQLSPVYGAAQYALALAYQKLGDAAQARDHMTVYQRNQLVEPSAGDDLLSAVSALNESALSHLRRGANEGAEGHIQEAIDEHLRALELDQGLTQAHVNLISLYGRAGRPDEAETHYRAAIALDPKLAESHYDFGVLMFEQRQYGKAAEAFRRTLELDPHNPEANHNLAFLLEQQGRTDDAVRHYRAALEDKPNYRLAHFHLGRLLLGRGNATAAIGQFQQTLTPEDESTPEFMYALAAAYVRSGDRQNALLYGRAAERKAESLGQKQLQAAIQRDLQKLDAKASR